MTIVHWTLIGHSLDTQWTLIVYSLDTHWTLIGHSLDTHWTLIGLPYSGNLKLASVKEEWRPDHSDATSHVGAAVLAHVARSGLPGWSGAFSKWQTEKMAIKLKTTTVFVVPCKFCWMNWKFSNLHVCTGCIFLNALFDVFESFSLLFHKLIQ